jgi:dihydroorotase-like cyclic amidohydrolase
MFTQIDHTSIWTSGRLNRLSILIHDERIEALFPSETADQFQMDQEINVILCWILPGGVDSHMNISDGPVTIQTGAFCAADGRFIPALDMTPFHRCISLEQFQNLPLNESVYWKYGARAKTAYPIQTNLDKVDLWLAICGGVIDILVCDHYCDSTPRIPKDLVSIKDAPVGIAGLEVSLPLLFISVVQKKIEMKKFVEITSETPDCLEGHSNRKSKIFPGMDDDLMIKNPKANWVVSPTNPFSRIETTSFPGWNFQGRVRNTIVRGKVIWDEKNIFAPEGFGKWIPSRN